MKFLIFSLLLIAASQAVDWTQVRPVHLTRPTLHMLLKNDGRIIGGDLAAVGQFPYQTAIFMDGTSFCGGSLITDSIVLTAAHCVKDITSFEVHLGALNIPNEAEEGRVIVTTTDAVMHERYAALVVNNDIAFLRLGQSVSGPNIKPVRLPSRSQESDLFLGTVATVSGWGKNSDASTSINPDLKYVDLTVITNAVCAETYGNVISPAKICVDTNGGLVSTCNGDSGGPLVFYEDDGEPTEIGIVSFGSSAGCESGAPAVFSRLTSYLNWLENNAGITIRP